MRRRRRVQVGESGGAEGKGDGMDDGDNGLGGGGSDMAADADLERK